MGGQGAAPLHNGVLDLGCAQCAEILRCIGTLHPSPAGKGAQPGGLGDFNLAGLGKGGLGRDAWFPFLSSPPCHCADSSVASVESFRSPSWYFSTRKMRGLLPSSPRRWRLAVTVAVCPGDAAPVPCSRAHLSAKGWLQHLRWELLSPGALPAPFSDPAEGCDVLWLSLGHCGEVTPCSSLHQTTAPCPQVAPPLASRGSPRSKIAGVSFQDVCRVRKVPCGDLNVNPRTNARLVPSPAAACGLGKHPEAGKLCGILQMKGALGMHRIIGIFLISLLTVSWPVGRIRWVTGDSFFSSVGRTKQCRRIAPLRGDLRASLGGVWRGSTGSTYHPPPCTLPLIPQCWHPAQS